MEPRMEVCYRSGIYLPALDLWLDPTIARERAVVSHAHSDHVRRHGVTVATPATARLIEHRYRRRGGFVELAWGERRDFGGFTLTLLPAGHVLGSAQVLVEHRGTRLLYSGDLRLAPSRTAEPAELPAADMLVVEATFGRPRYRFPPADLVMAEIVAFCRAALADGCTPVLCAYSLGKGQELLHRLGDAGLAVALHPAVHGLTQVYERLGVRFPPYALLRGGVAPGTVVICPPQGRRGQAMAGLGRTRTAYVSGWAVDRGTRHRLGVDAAFPLSDHADYDELLRYVHRVGARRVYTLYGFADEFAADLRALGHDARPLDGSMQYRLL
jgi:Cft2 family RNA processing exonuclease